MSEVPGEHPRASGGAGTLWLVRHGESVANAGGATWGFDTIPLTDRGRAQAASVAEACPGPPDWVGVSPYLRAMQSAEPLLARYPEVRVERLPVQEFNYLFADWSGGTTIEDRRPRVDAYWTRMDPGYRDGEGVESFDDLRGRADSFLRWAVDRPGWGVVFTHELFVRAVLLAAIYGEIGDPVDAMRRFLALRVGLPIPNGAIVRLRSEGGRWWLGGIDGSHRPEA